MNNISSYLKLSFKFFQDYYRLYFKVLLLPIAFTLVGFTLYITGILYGILALLFNLIIFSVNTFWYSERCQKEILQIQ